MSDRSYQICKRCVMDTTDPLISFNEEGFCNHCVEFVNIRSKYLFNPLGSEQELLAIVEKMKKAGRGKRYDCIVGISGGVDSSYVAYMCKKFGLRVLGVHMDNGWNAEEANLNIKNISNKLEIDYQSYVLDWNEFKDLQLSFLKASVPEAETPTDVAIQGAIHKVAAKYGVKYIISGGNMASEGILPKAWHYNAKDNTYINHIHKVFGKVTLKNFPDFSYWKEMYYKLFKGINIIYLLNYVAYVKDDAMQILKDELDWKYYGGKHYESKYTSFIQSYYLYTKFPIDYRRATFSSQICTGEISREEAIEVLKTQPYKNEEVEANKKYVAKKLGISDVELAEILSRPSKFFYDYPNNDKMLSFIYSTYRKLYGKEKLGST